MEVLLDIGQRYYPELRRWTVKEELEGGAWVLEDRQAQDILEIPQYCFAVFPAGNPTVVPYDVMTILAPPNPRVVVPNIDTMEKKSEFAQRMNILIGDNMATKIVVDGPNNEFVYLDFPVEYLHLPKWTPLPSEGYFDGERGRVRVSEGDTLFSYIYPREVGTSKYDASGGIDYIPTSVVDRDLSIPALESLDLTGGVAQRDWTTLWPTPAPPKDGPFVTLKKYAKLMGIEYYVAEYRYKSGLLEGARLSGRDGSPLVPLKLIEEGK